jgi:short-subunit dehydrogenase involved in D-alanine esterification of teichoic acids
MGNQANPGKGYASVLSHQEQHFNQMFQLLVAIHKTLNLLVENAGLGDKLEALTLELRGPTDKLEAAVEANQPK